MNIVVPFGQLKPETLQVLLEEFVTRDGAVQGHSDVPLQRMIEEVHRQLKAGKAVIVFDEEDESCSVMLKDQLAGTPTVGDADP